MVTVFMIIFWNITKTVKRNQVIEEERHKKDMMSTRDELEHCIQLFRNYDKNECKQIFY